MSQSGRRLQRVASKEPELYITPASGSFNNGDTLVVTIMENSYSEEVNAVQANFSYPTAQLTFQSISTASGAFPTQIQAQGGSGSVQIGVGILGNSLSGVQEVARVTFSVTGTGTAPLIFTSGSGIARASDSMDICKKRTGSSYTIS